MQKKINNVTSILLFLLLSQQALACKCKDKPTLEEKHDNSDLVVMGRVVSTKLIQLDGREFVEATYETIETYKGKDTKSGIVLDSLTSCRLGIRTGVRYMFYLKNNNKHVGYCSGSHSIYPNNRQNKEELKKLKSLLDQ